MVFIQTLHCSLLLNVFIIPSLFPTYLWNVTFKLPVNPVKSFQSLKVIMSKSGYAAIVVFSVCTSNNACANSMEGSGQRFVLGSVPIIILECDTSIFSRLEATTLCSHRPKRHTKYFEINRSIRFQLDSNDINDVQSCWISTPGVLYVAFLSVSGTLREDKVKIGEHEN